MIAGTASRAAGPNGPRASIRFFRRPSGDSRLSIASLYNGTTAAVTAGGRISLRVTQAHIPDLSGGIASRMPQQRQDHRLDAAHGSGRGRRPRRRGPLDVSSSIAWRIAFGASNFSLRA